eukprot:4737196-Prymnesium_polylepis.1
MRSWHEKSPSQGLAPHALMRNNGREHKAPAMHPEHDDNAASASRHAQQPFPNAGMPGRRPDSPLAGAGLGVKEPAMSAEVAFDLERRP